MKKSGRSMNAPTGVLIAKWLRLSKNGRSKPLPYRSVAIKTVIFVGTGVLDGPGHMKVTFEEKTKNTHHFVLFISRNHFGPVEKRSAIARRSLQENIVRRRFLYSEVVERRANNVRPYRRYVGRGGACSSRRADFDCAQDDTDGGGPNISAKSSIFSYEGLQAFLRKNMI